MAVLVTDQERGLASEEAAQWLDRWGIQLKTKEPGAHAQIVERHHELLRKLVQRVKAQLREEGITMPIEIVVAECFIIKNLLLSVGGGSPYVALYGRVPPLLAEFEPASECQLDDTSAGIPGISRSHHRLREVTVTSMVELTAKQRIQRALNSKTRISQEQLTLEKGDQIDFYRTPATKDESGWRGPAIVIEPGPPTVVKWQDRFLQVRTQDVRRSLVYLAFLGCKLTGEQHTYENVETGEYYKVNNEDPLSVLTAFAEGLDCRIIRLGWLNDQGWRRAEANITLSEVLLAALHVAACGLHLSGCIGVRIGSGVSALEGVIGYDGMSFLWWWHKGDTSRSWYYECPGTQRIKLTEVCGKDEWTQVSFVQFLTAEDSIVQEIRTLEPRIPNIGGPTIPRLTLPPELPTPTAPPAPIAPTTTATRPDPMSARSDISSMKMQSARSRSRDNSPRSNSEPVLPITEDGVPSPDSARSRTPRHNKPKQEPKAKAKAAPKVTAPSPRTEPTKRPTEPNQTTMPKKKKHEPQHDEERQDTGGAASSSGPILPLVESASEDECAETVEYETDDSDATQDYPESMHSLLTKMQTGSAVDGFDNCGTPDSEHFVGWTGSSSHVSTGVFTGARVARDSPPGEIVAEMALGGELKDWVYPSGPHRRKKLKRDEVYVVRYYHSGQSEVVVEREMNILSLDEARANEVEVRRAIFDELQRWNSLKGFQRYPKAKARNVIDSRWVIKWKMVDGKRVIRARLTARGFKDAQAQEVSTFAGTATRWGQRLVNLMCAQNKWTLFSADIGQAFLRGLTFEQIDSMEGEIHRDVQITVPPGSVPVLRELNGYETFDPTCEVLQMLRGGFGLKDAPRLWQKMLQMVLERAGGRSLISEPKLYVFYTGSKLRLIMSSHVDDLKGGGDEEERERVLAHLEKEFGTLKKQFSNFECIGIMHVQDARSCEIWTHQHHYLLQLRPISEDSYVMADGNGPVTETTHSAYRSLLGGIAWLTQTMIAISVYVAALQRSAKAPTINDIRNLNRLLRWIRTNKEKLGIRYKYLAPPWRLAVVSDSAFQALEYEGLAMRGCLIMMISATAPLPTDSAWECVCLDWYARKHTHVVRSTFAAELYALLDAVGQGISLNMTVTEIFQGALTVQELAQKQETGGLYPQLDAFIDAKAVFDGIAADPVKPPAERNLYIHLLAAKDMIQKRLVSRLIWIDTIDMLSDGLTKGSLDRSPLLDIATKGSWKLSGLTPAVFSTKATSALAPAVSSTKATSEAQQS